MNPVEMFGRTLIGFARELGSVLILFSVALKQLVIPPYEVRNTFKQMLEIGIRSLPVVFITAVFTGMVLSLQTYTGFKRFGAETLVGTVVALSMTRELGPVLTGLIVAGRAGAAMAAELGTMRVTEQIDALETLATNPVKYLIVPRFISGVLMLPALAIVTDIVGVIGGFVISVGLFGANSVSYWNRTWDYLELDDIYSGLIKASFFGASISLISCYKGFYTEGGAEGVGKATTGAVVLSSMTILISDYFLSAWLFR
ncbi:Phospholipid ABC transporter permease protein MlaE [hydrothermal vent metagenome]|uniref:Phospholipid ABC transporter permease protein MlaE n=1 Tax=hydrothermal vent metagenome TaxID=652676 RepID=A0A3B1C961_9ZZZZ